MTGQPSPSKRRRGGQPGNTNALKHGLYSRRLNPSDLYRLGVNSGYTTGQQIAQLRLYLQDLFESGMDMTDFSEALVRLQQISVASGVLARLIRRRKKLPVSRPTLRRAVAQALIGKMLKEKKASKAASPPPPDPDTN